MVCKLIEEYYLQKCGYGRNIGNTNFGEHWSKSPGDERALVSSARRRPRKTVGVPGNAKHFWGRGDATERAAGRELASGQLE
jgi:hypothetical protein